MPTKKKRTEIVVKKQINLDDIENTMVELITNATTPKDIFVANQKIDMLTKMAAFKMKRLEIEAQKQMAVVTQAEPLQLEIVRANTPEQENRIKLIDEQVLAGKGKNGDA